MSNNIKITLFIVSFVNLFLLNILLAEPFVVHEYATSNQEDNKNNIKDFDKNENYSFYYNIKKNDSLSGILNEFYGKNLNLNVIKAAVVLKNKHAFVRNNANFMFANKKLYLPSINEIKNLVYKNKKKKNYEHSGFTKEQDIYYFGN
tara:strand:- start:141 stop:581 length:441 start_codon:yes stop_codon:yes gene_type:complete